MPDQTRLPDRDGLFEEAMMGLLEALMNNDFSPPPPTVASSKSYMAVHGYITHLKEALLRFSKGEFDFQVDLKGVTAGYAKAIQSNIKHLAWQCQSVADGELGHRVDFMGDLSKAFNNMIESLVLQKKSFEETQRQMAALTQAMGEAEAALAKAREAASRHPYCALMAHPETDDDAEWDAVD